MLPNMKAMIANGISFLIDDNATPAEDYSSDQRREQAMFKELLNRCPGLPKELLRATQEEEDEVVGNKLKRGVACARSDDTKNLKKEILPWIAVDGNLQNLNPQLHRNVKTNRGFHHPRTGQLLCPVDLDWKDADIRRDTEHTQAPASFG
ncbi:hypothetical protein HWV62_26927 [Athelia sp. TMB]|nr:hypothetical protein HWV62_26927 [Athelia sp. TMB]